LWKGYGGGLGTDPQRKNPIFGRLGILAQGFDGRRLDPIGVRSFGRLRILAFSRWWSYLFLMDRAIDPKLASNPVFLRVMQDALAIQDRFSAEPVYARTGKGFLKSAGVKEIAAAKVSRKPGKS
jgi:hypothetical protein